MKRLTLILGLLVALAGAATARDPETIKVQLGQSRAAQSGRITVRFISVVEDSRCPMNARCIWAGNARVRLAVSRGRSSRTIVLNSNKGEQSAEAFGFKIEFADLQPQKGAPRPMSRRPQTVTLNVERAGS
jgi:hypothetical protein